MPIHYKVVGCTNPAGQQGVEYATDRETKSATLTMEDLAEKISEATTITPPDVLGIITKYMTTIYQEVARGNSVRMWEIGLFQPSLKSRCFRQTAIQAEGFNPAGYITSKKVRFRADAALKNRLAAHATFKRDPSDLMV